MAQRQYNGKPGQLRVVLNYGPLGFVQATTHHIAYDHMLVDTGHITLNQQAEVEIVLSLPLPGAAHCEHHRISAEVIHCSADGHTTLGFRGCGERTLQALSPYLTLH